MFDHKDGVSQRQGAKKFNCAQQHISKTLKKKERKIKPRKKKTIPKRSDQQKAVARTKCS